ncbi:MAG: hypothetical protein WC292_00250 [Clostridia bacterium]
MTEQEKIIYDTLEVNFVMSCTSKDNRLTRSKLSYLTGWDDRTLRANIAIARRLKLKIISDNTKGYWLGNNEEWDEFCDRERGRAMASLYPKSTEIDGQIEIVFKPNWTYDTSELTQIKPVSNYFTVESIVGKHIKAELCPTCQGATFLNGECSNCKQSEELPFDGDYIHGVSCPYCGGNNTVSLLDMIDCSDCGMTSWT